MLVHPLKSNQHTSYVVQQEPLPLVSHNILRQQGGREVVPVTQITGGGGPGRGGSGPGPRQVEAARLGLLTYQGGAGAYKPPGRGERGGGWQQKPLPQKVPLCRLKARCGLKVSTDRTLVKTFRSQQPMTRHAHDPFGRPSSKPYTLVRHDGMQM